MESSRKLIKLQKIETFEDVLWGNMNLEEGSSKVIENEITKNKAIESKRTSKPELKIITNQRNLTNSARLSKKDVDWKAKRNDFMEKQKKAQTLPKEQKKNTDNIKTADQKSKKCRIF